MDCRDTLFGCKYQLKNSDIKAQGHDYHHQQDGQQILQLNSVDAHHTQITVYHRAATKTHESKYAFIMLSKRVRAQKRTRPARRAIKRETWTFKICLSSTRGEVKGYDHESTYRVWQENTAIAKQKKSTLPGQVRQPVAPAPGANFPSGHGPHAEYPVTENTPGLQILHAVDRGSLE
jgi:hypothetical protein